MSSKNVLNEVVDRIKELREISGYSIEDMAVFTDVSVDLYEKYESGGADLPFTFLHKCAQTFGVGMTDLMAGSSAKLSLYNVTRKGKGVVTAREDGIEIVGLSTKFRHKIAEPFYVKYAYSPEQQNQPIHLTTHSGQEFDMILKGKLKVQVGNHIEILNEGDSIYYDSGTPHGMIAVDGEDCEFLAVVLPGEETDTKVVGETIIAAKQTEPLIYNKFVTLDEDERGALKNISFKNDDQFNFAFDVVDVLGETKPDKLAMLHLDRNKLERRFTFGDLKKASAKAANYLKSLGIRKGDRVMLILRRNYQFWITLLALHKIGAVMIPATDQLLKKDLVYRFNSAGVSAVICTADSNTWKEIDASVEESPTLKHRIMCNGVQEGWHDFDSEYEIFSSKFERTADTAQGNDPLLMFFTSGTTGYPKIAAHSHKYPLGHFITAKYWHCVDPDGIHFTISDTGWGKALWGKIYGQWLNEAAVFTYDFDRFNANDILPMFAKYGITTFCAPPTMYRFMIKEDLSRFDLSSIKHATIAGEALNPEVFYQFKKATGLSLMEGFGQTETTLTIANFIGMRPKPGSMGKPSPQFDVDLIDREGNPVGVGETGEIVVRTDKKTPVGLFLGYYMDEDKTKDAWHDGMYHTGDTAWRDEDGHFWYVGRVDDLIKSSGYRIGPFEIESVIMELPYVLECGVSAAPDEIRGQVVKASIVLTKGTEPTDELKKEIQNYVKKRTAPYKYPRIVVFRDELPKTISGKIQRNKL
ncbi:MAG: cupin domain-containing protein [Ruminococcaceae bacterium]|nr:cupin domain-containing protein [Oscillospiraceae bacterium]